MSLKNDINRVKEELNAEEKFFEKAVVTEKFIKKYKNVMVGAVVVAVVGIGGSMFANFQNQRRIENVNITLLQLQKEPANQKLQMQLESLSPVAKNVWDYSQAVEMNNSVVLQKLQNSTTFIINDLAKYELAQRENDEKRLSEYASREGAIFRDLAQIQSAVILMQQGDITVAREKLSTISENSSFYKVAKALLHYGVK